jgi:hypothetical protein
MQSDGNFVAFNAAGQQIWSSGTSGHVGATLKVGPSAVMIVTPQNQVLWSATAPPGAPQVQAVAPNSGGNQGGATVVIQGLNFSISPRGTVINFGGRAATAVNCSTTTQCTATSPPYGDGSQSFTVDVAATVASLSSQTGPQDHFTFSAGPKCTSQLTCPEKNAPFPNLQVQCPSKVRFIDSNGVQTLGTSTLFGTTDNAAFGRACDTSTNSCDTYNLFEVQYQFCGRPLPPPPQPADFCAECRKTGGTCSGPTPAGQMTCVHQ